MDDVECLNIWPKNTKGYCDEYKLLSTLLLMCDEHGYGRIPQLCEQIEDIWRNPEKKESYAAMRDRHLKEMESFRNDFGGEKF